MMKNLLIIGATSSIAQACIQQWCEQKDVAQLHLIARDREKMNLLIADLKVRYPTVLVSAYIVDALEIEAITQKVHQIFDQGQIDLCFMVQGVMYLDETQLSPLQVQNLVQLNCTSIATTVDAAYQRMQLQKKGKIAVIGSVAGDRGRKANYFYGASKSFVATYIRGLQHKIALKQENIQVSLIKPGPTESEMTVHLIEEGKKLAPVKDVAQIIVQGIEKNQSTIYAPKIWRIIMLVIQHLPFFVFKKLDI